MSTSYNLSLLELVVARAELRICARLAWLEHRANESETDELATHSPELEDSVRAQWSWLRCRAGQSDARGPLLASIERTESALAGIRGEPLRMLAAIFLLTRAESDVLEGALAWAAAPHLATMVAGLPGHEDAHHLTHSLVARLYEIEWPAFFGPAASQLSAWALVTTGASEHPEGAPLIVDPQVLHWLEGEIGIRSRWALALRTLPSYSSLQTMIHSATVDAVVGAIDEAVSGDCACRVVVALDDEQTALMQVSQISALRGMTPIICCSDAVTDADWPELFLQVQRTALLTCSTPTWTGVRATRAWPSHPRGIPLQFIVMQPAQPVVRLAGYTDLWFADFARQSQASGPGTTRPGSVCVPWTEGHFHTMVARHRHAQLPEPTESPPDNSQDSSSCPRPDCAARPNRSTRVDAVGGLDIEDSCVADLPICAHAHDQLRSLLSAVEHHENGSNVRLGPGHAGLTGLLIDNGSHMAVRTAFAVANELGRDLIRVDLDSITRQSWSSAADDLQRICAWVRRMSAVLLVECPNQDFYCNTEDTNLHSQGLRTALEQLLFLLRDCPGVTLVAADHMGDDEAYALRRMGLLVELNPTR